MLEYKDMTADDIVVFALTGNMSAFADTGPIREKIKMYLDGKQMKFVLDLAEVSWISSEGIGFLASTMATVTKAGGRVVLSNTNERVERVLAITRCNTIMKHFGSRQEAVEFLKGQ